MMALRFTLLSEGSSDRALIPIIVWTLRQHGRRNFQAQWADLRGLLEPPRSLEKDLDAALQLYPCELLFVHLDADSAGRKARVEKISRAVRHLHEPPTVCVIPVRTMEAWFLFHEQAIRFAAGNPNGSMELDLPRWSEIEALRKPKEKLIGLLRQASGLSARRRRGVRWHRQIHRIAELIDDFSPLRRLSAFDAFEKDLTGLLAARGW
jgi:hypothetical protein